VGRSVVLDSGLGSAVAFLGLVLLLSRSSIFLEGRSDGDLLHLSPGLMELSSLELGNLVEVVLDLDDEFSFTLSVLFLERSFSDVVASQLVGETLHELGKVVGVLVVVEEEVHVSKLVLERETLGNGEVRADGEELHSLLDFGFVSEVVGDTEGKSVVVLDGEASSSERGAEHSSLHGGSFNDALKGFACSEKFLFLENFLKDGGDNGSTGAVTEELN